MNNVFQSITKYTVEIYFQIYRLNTQYVSDKLFQNLTADLNACNKDFSIMQDSAPVHKCKTVISFIENASIKIIPWPARSPDLNILENIWHMMAEIVYNNHQYRSLEHPKGENRCHQIFVS